jgi:predicted enzyme related to lactoylglutathione lyase
MFKGLETVVYFVEDLKAASDWYRKALGVEPYFDTPYYVGFTVGGDEFGLHPAEDTKPGTQGQIGYWSVSDIKAEVARLVELGAKPQKVDEVGGGIMIGTVLDPFGNSLGLIQNPKSPNR